MAAKEQKFSIPAKIAAGMLVLGILDWSWGYYDLMRLIVCGAAAYVAWCAKQQKGERLFWIMVVVAIIYNPISPVHFERALWVALNLATAAAFWLAATNPKRFEK